jgi:hypothetical protein
LVIFPVLVCCNKKSGNPGLAEFWAIFLTKLSGLSGYLHVKTDSEDRVGRDHDGPGEDELRPALHFGEERSGERVADGEGALKHGCQIFLRTMYQNGKEITKIPQNILTT